MAETRTYLWMHPIYGAAGLALGWLSRRMQRVPKPLRPLPYLGVIYAAEYASGWALRRTLGRCPWDYEQRGVNLHGLIRLDYAPAWWLLGYAFESIRDRVEMIEKASLTPSPPKMLPAVEREAG